MSSNSNYIPDFHQESCTLNFTIITHSNAFENKVYSIFWYFQVIMMQLPVGVSETIKVCYNYIYISLVTSKSSHIHDMWDDPKRIWPSVIWLKLMKGNKVSSGFDIPFSIEKQLISQGNIFKVPMNIYVTHRLWKKLNIFNLWLNLAATTSSQL